MSSRIFTAKFPGQCRLCNAPIQIGDQVTWARRGPSKGQHAHLECWNNRVPSEDDGEDSDETPVIEIAPPAPASGTAADGMAVLARMIEPHLVSTGVDAARNAAMAAIASAANDAAAKLKDESAWEDLIARAVQKAAMPQRIEVVTPGAESRDCGIQHKQFPLLVHLIAQRQHSCLVGDPGSGKTHAVQAAATALGMRFGYLSLHPQSGKAELFGFRAANGEAVIPEFVEIATGGGVFLFDEIDNGSSAVLAQLNAVVANGICMTPNGTQKVSPDFVMIGSANTWGNGANWRFPERRKLDESIKSRLTTIQWQYDRDLERAIALTIGDAEVAEPWLQWVWAVREYSAKRENGIKGIYADSRSIFAGLRHIVSAPEAITLDDICQWVIWKDGEAESLETRRKVLAACPRPVKIGGRK